VTDRYIPALRFHVLTRVYDPLLSVVLREHVWKSRLVVQTALKPGMRVLDLGCGTGTLTILLARSCPGLTVVGLDADPQVLARARQKALEENVDVEFVRGMADAPPFAETGFDRVVSSLFFHHLRTDGKRQALAAARRLLRPDGELHLADWGKPRDPLMRTMFLLVQLLDGFETTSDNVRGRLPELVVQAGFGQVTETYRRRTLLGTIALLRASVA
jgi:ubiquinone/menaquinone biosynthesis C-methylase UbiE